MTYTSNRNQASNFRMIERRSDLILSSSPGSSNIVGSCVSDAGGEFVMRSEAAAPFWDGIAAGPKSGNGKKGKRVDGWLMGVALLLLSLGAMVKVAFLEFLASESAVSDARMPTASIITVRSD